MATITLEHPPIDKPAAIRLTRQWSDYEAGNIIITDAKKIANMAKKNYGEIIPVPKSEPPKKKESPAIETAVDTGPSLAEKAVAPPQMETKTEENHPRTRKHGKGGD